jgi:hypothetical protein
MTVMTFLEYAKKEEGDRWITIHPGGPESKGVAVLIDKNGKIKSGHFKGKDIDSIGGDSKEDKPKKSQKTAKKPEKEEPKAKKDDKPKEEPKKDKEEPKAKKKPEKKDDDKPKEEPKDDKPKEEPKDDEPKEEPKDDKPKSFTSDDDIKDFMKQNKSNASSVLKKAANNIRDLFTKKEKSQYWSGGMGGYNLIISKKFDDVLSVSKDGTIKVDPKAKPEHVARAKEVLYQAFGAVSENLAKEANKVTPAFLKDITIGKNVHKQIPQKPKGRLGMAFEDYSRSDDYIDLNGSLRTSKGKDTSHELVNALDNAFEKMKRGYF